jgi:hypothetical protein
MGHRDTSLGGAAVKFADTVWGMIERARDDSPEGPPGRASTSSPALLEARLSLPPGRLGQVERGRQGSHQAFFLWLTDRQALAPLRPRARQLPHVPQGAAPPLRQHNDQALDRIKRGGGRVFIPLDQDDASLSGIVPDPKALSPDDAFEKEWRNTLMAAAGRARPAPPHRRGRGRQVPRLRGVLS